MSDNQPQEMPKDDLIVTRIIDSPVEKVWHAWTDPALVQRWWGPRYYTSPSCQIDLREGGRFIFAMQAPAEQGGSIHYTSGVYQKIVPQEFLEFVQSISDEDGNPIDPTTIGMPPDFPREILTTVEFKALSPDFTELTITERDWPMSQMSVFSLAGLHQTVDKLRASLK